MPTTAQGIEYLRTPEERFADLPGWPYETHYLEVDGLRVAYVDEGPAHAAPLLLVHGEPTWGYLYRKMIPGLVAAGHRVVVPDLIGFGRSDKPIERTAYTYSGMVNWLEQVVETLELDHVTAFFQDWGGLLGLRVVAAQPERFARVIVANTALPAIQGVELPAYETSGGYLPADFSNFFAWHAYSQQAPELKVGEVVQAGTTTELPADVVAAYDAPFPDESYKSGARELPNLVLSEPDANAAAWEKLAAFDGPILCGWAPEDPILGNFDTPFLELPAAQGQPHRTFDGASHFLQEDGGEDIAAWMVEVMGAVSP